MHIPSWAEIKLNLCDRIIFWLFIHSAYHRKPAELELFFAWANYIGYDCYINYGPDQPYKDREPHYDPSGSQP